MAIKWMLFPRSSRPSPAVEGLIRAFEAKAAEIDSKIHNHHSNEVLAMVCDPLVEIGYSIERGKQKSEKISVPVLFGLNGVVEKSFNADGFHPGEGVVLEVEAGRGVDNNQFLKDLFQACAMQDAKHLVICVRNDYRGNDDFSKVVAFFETLYVSNRVHLPLETITILGY
jgi:hypothetical protein